MQKPSGTIAIGGNLDLRQRKFYNGFLYNSKIQLEKDSDKDQFSVTLNELKKFLNVSEDDKNNNYYKRIIDELYKTSVEYNLLGKDRTITGKAHALDNIEYDVNKITGEVIIKYTIPIVVKKTMIKIIKGDPDSLYASIDLIVIRGLKRKYSIILYEICKDYEKKEVPKISIDDFKKLFGLISEEGKKYRDFFSIRKKVLDPACEELNSNPNINFTVSYELTKTANTYTHIKFIAKPKSKQKALADLKDQSQLSILLSAVPEEHRTKQLENYLAKCLQNNDAKYLLHQIEYINSQKPKNYFAYLKKAIQDDYANNEKANFQEEKEKLKEK